MWNAGLPIKILKSLPGGISVGGEIGEVGQRNSTVQELHAFMTAFMTELQDRERMLGRNLAGKTLM